MLVEWLPLCEIQGDHFCIMPRMLHRVWSYLCMCTYTHAHIYVTNSAIYKYMYSIRCMLYELCMCLCVHLCAPVFVYVYQPFCSHCSSCPEPWYSLRQRGSETTGDKNRATAAMDFLKVETFPLQMRDVSSVAMWAGISYQIKNTFTISNTSKIIKYKNIASK